MLNLIQFSKALTLTLSDTVTVAISSPAVYGYTVLIAVGVGSIFQAGSGVTLLDPAENSDAIGFMSFGNDEFPIATKSCIQKECTK